MTSIQTPDAARAQLPWLRITVVMAVACVLPFFLSNYHVFQASMVLSTAIALVGLNILTGYSGQISLGHGAFLAIGAYTTAILMDKFDVPYWATIPVAGLVCLVAGFLFGLPALKLEGHYLALATFALAVALPQLLKFRYLEPWTGGVQGIVIMTKGQSSSRMLTQRILGGSGSGKSVTIKCVLGLITPDEGSIEIDGVDVLRLPRRDREALMDRIGMLFQNGALINWLTVADNVALPLREHSRLPKSELDDRVRGEGDDAVGGGGAQGGQFGEAGLGEGGWGQGQ
jgi:hypothetical protein